jgi:outer membrane protein assembly factor BamB
VQRMFEFTVGFALVLMTGCSDMKTVSSEPKPVPLDAPASAVAESPEASEAPGIAVLVDPPTPVDDRPGDDWPVFLGPHGTGVSDETGLLDKWPEAGPPVLWEKRIGKGYSSPSVIGHRVVIHHRQRDRDLIECLRVEDGELFWQYEYDTDFADPYGYNNGPRCSPLLTKTRCFTFGAQGQLICLDLETGRLVWERDTAKEWNVPNHFFGAGCTPILDGDLLIVLVGGQPDSGVVAMNAETGKTVWESIGKQTWDGAETDQNGKRYRWTGDEMLVSYSSPIMATIHGEKHLLCLVRQGLVSLDPANGNVRFKYWFRARVHESVNAARPVVIDDLVFLSAAYETGAALLRIKPDSQSYEVVWREKRGMSTHWSTPIYRDGCLYGFSGRHEGEATLQCVDLKTGELAWETNGYDGPPADLRTNNQGEIVDSTGEPATFFGRGSMTAADGKYILLGERGILVLANLNREKFDQISRANYKQIHYPAWAAPVLSRGRLYLRSEDHLLCLDIAKTAVSDQ